MKTGSILRGLFNGNIIPWERREPHNEALLETVRKIEETETYFVGKLPQEDVARFQALSSLHSDLSAIGEENAFSYGFTLGLLLMVDVLGEAELMINK